MTLRIIGEHPLATNGGGALKSRIATIFPRAGVLVTLPGIHATQRLAYVQDLNQQRQKAGQPPLTDDEEAQEWEQSVDLITDPDRILIRPDPENMPLAFEADEALQELVSKQKVRYLMQSDARVRQAIKERGECWRINPLPQTATDMAQMIRNAQMRVATTVVYYYNHITGTKHLTLQEFARLEALPPEGLARSLQEIRELTQRHNRLFNVEVDFFGVTEAPLGKELEGDLTQTDPARVRKYFLEALARFHTAVPPDLREDNTEHLAWRNRMFAALVGERDQSPPEEILLGLSPEFFMQIEWLPGGRIVNNELIFDPIFDENDQRPDDPELRSLCDERAKGFIFNFLREFTDIEYINVGRVVTSLSKRGVFMGRRGVFIAEMKRQGSARPIVRILRMQKWGIWEHLDENKDLCWAIMESEDYTDYILDRRLACRQLGMNLPPQVSTRRIMESYAGVNHAYQGRRIWATYFEREYVHGVASDKIPPSRYANPEFCRRFARLLGCAAATNLIVGRMTTDTQTVLFDDGDEIIIEDEQSLPVDLVVSDHTGTFTDFKTDLVLFAADYANPFNRRRALLANPDEFAEIYLTTFQARFVEIQEEFRKRRHAFLALFKLLHRDEPGGFGFRWERVLARLDQTDACALVAVLRSHMESSATHP
ncbi:MAG: hypothetical protein EPN23_06480 [Verrucomicrobia bacterium]|nr:MAG: hypothetical protein EPN23_06480 [Verrucomicrobiota bacterium]